MQWFLRSVMVLAVIVILVGLVRHEWILQFRSAENDDSDQAGETISANLSANGDPANAPAIADDTGSPPPANLKNPITRGLSQVIEGQDAILGDSGDSLRDSLNQADTLLSNAKQSNRNAIREANRQVRIRHGNSNTPDVVFVVINGLNASDLGCFGGDESTSGFDSIALTGLRQKIKANGDEASVRSALMMGDSTADMQKNLLMPTFWQAGYATAVIGDASWWRASETPDIDFWFGNKVASEAEPYPELLWSNGSELKLTGNADGKQGIAAHELFSDEAVDFIGRYRSRQPYFLTLTVDLNSGFPQDWKQPEKVAATNQMVVDLENALAARKWTGKTLFLIAGISTDGADGPLLARWPDHIPPNMSIVNKSIYQDLPKTLLSLTNAQRRPPSLKGKTLAATWLGRAASP